MYVYPPQVRAGVLSERGGSVELTCCRFEALTGNDVGLRLSADTVGVVKATAVPPSGSLWGRLAPPLGVEYVEAGSEDAVAMEIEGMMAYS